MSSPNIPLLSLESDENSFHDAIEGDEKLWAQYVSTAVDFDKQMIDEWTKLVDTILVYDALFIGILSAFAIGSGNGLQRDPGDITNDLLVAIYIRLSNSSAPVVDPNSFFQMNPDDQNNANYLNTLLFTSLTISIIASLLAAVVKLWLLRYSRTVTPSGPPLERALRRQETYNGALAWKLKEIIESLPVFVIIAATMFGFYIHYSIMMVNATLSFTIGLIFALGLVGLILTSISGAFIPTSPFQSAFSDFIRFVFRIFPDYPLSARDKSPTILRISSLILTSVVLVIVGAHFSLKNHTGSTLTLLCFPGAAVIALLNPQPEKDRTMKPRLWGVPGWALFSAVTTLAVMLIAAWNPWNQPPKIISICVGSALMALQGYYGIRMSKFAPDTTRAEAVTWMLKNSTSRNSTWFQKAREIGSTEINRAVLFHNLLPLLSPVIISIPHQTKHTELNPNQVVYVACLADLCRFAPSADSFWKSLWNNEAPFPRPSFSNNLREKLGNLRDCTQCPQQVQDDAKLALESSKPQHDTHLSA